MPRLDRSLSSVSSPTGAMKVVILVVSCALLLCVADRPRFECPAAGTLGACSCDESPAQVVCRGLDDADDVSRSLANNFNSPIPQLKLLDGSFSSLSAGFLANVSVERLYINGSQLERVSPNAFSGASSLGFLMLAENQLREAPSEALKKLPRLLTLSLYGNRIARLNASSLATLRKLKFLVLSYNKIDYLEPGVFSPGLERLVLSKNNLSTLNGAIRNLGSLEWLFAGSNQIKTVAGELDGLFSLKLLNLDNNKLTSLEGSFTSLRSLQTLSLRSNWIEHIGDAFAPLTHLRHLNLSKNHLSTLEPQAFANLTQLQTLDLSRNFLTEIGPALNHLKHLERLNLSRNSLSAVRLDEIKWLKDLRELDLSQNQISSVDVTFGHYLSRVSVLNLSDNRLKRIHNGIHYLHDLNSLDLSYNSISSLDKRDLAKNKRLRRIDMQGNPWRCDASLVRVLQDLYTRMVELVGVPHCYLAPDRFHR